MRAQPHAVDVPSLPSRGEVPRSGGGVDRKPQLYTHTMTSSNHTDLDEFYDHQVRPQIDELHTFRTRRWMLLLALTLLLLALAAIAAGLFAHLVIADEDVTTAFAVGLGLSMGPAVLLNVLAYLALVRTPLRERYAEQILRPALRQFKPEDVADHDSPPLPNTLPLKPVVDTQRLRTYLDTITHK